MRSDDENSSFLNEVLGAYLKHRFQDAKEAMSWAEENGLNSSTMRDVFYRNGFCGRQVFNQIVTQLFNITPNKVASIIDQVKNIEPISESQKIWNLIDAPEKTKRRLALTAKAILEVESALNKENQDSGPQGRA